MDDISKLLQEAKPLYFAHKRRNNRIKAALGMALLAVGLNFGVSVYKPAYNSYENNVLVSMLEQQTSSSEQESVIEEMGLPVDDYGLLMIG